MNHEFVSKVFWSLTFFPHILPITSGQPMLQNTVLPYDVKQKTQYKKWSIIRTVSLY